MNKYYAEENEIMYHTGLSKELIQNASYAVVPGDPARVNRLVKMLHFLLRIRITRLGLLM